MEEFRRESISPECKVANRRKKGETESVKDEYRVLKGDRKECRGYQGKKG